MVSKTAKKSNKTPTKKGDKPAGPKSSSLLKFFSPINTNIFEPVKKEVKEEVISEGDVSGSDIEGTPKQKRKRELLNSEKSDVEHQSDDEKSEKSDGSQISLDFIELDSDKKKKAKGKPNMGKKIKLSELINGSKKSSKKDKENNEPKKKKKAESEKKKRKRKIDDVDEEEEEEETYEVEEIFDRRMKSGKVEYFVKWVGYPESDNTWEPADNLQGCDIVIAEYEKKQKIKILNSKMKVISDVNAIKETERSNNKSQLDSEMKPEDEDTKLEGSELEVDTVLSGVKIDGKLMFVIKWKNDTKNLVPAEFCYEKFPRLMCEFFQSQIEWMEKDLDDMDDSGISSPDKSILEIKDDVELTPLKSTKKKRKSVSWLDETIDEKQTEIVKVENDAICEFSDDKNEKPASEDDEENKNEKEDKVKEDEYEEEKKTNEVENKENNLTAEDGSEGEKQEEKKSSQDSFTSQEAKELVIDADDSD